MTLFVIPGLQPWDCSELSIARRRLEVVAEGVEAAEQLQKLRELDCD
jgi:hypothetical protein